jgi:hypothetical protein
MDQDSQAKRQRLAQLEEDLKDLKATLPEHCTGTEGYVGVHRATPAHWQKIEDLEEEIKVLKAELAGGAED